MRLRMMIDIELALIIIVKMYKLELARKSEDKLNYIKSSDITLFNSIILSLKEIQNNFPEINNVKNIWDNIYRKRVWRWRILFTLASNIVTVWIIDIEKDTKKDYKKWKDYIISKL